MAKNDLIGGSLWEQYSSKVSDRMNNPTHLGEITAEQAESLGATLVVADWGAEACGDAVRLYWAVERGTDRILEAKFKTFGCGTAIASSDMMAEMCIGQTVDEAISITNIDVEMALRDKTDKPSIPPQKMHCSVMAYDVIKKAASIFKGVDMSLLEEEEIVCECARVTLGTIKDVIRINNLTTVEQITQYTKAGAFCKSCIRPGGHEERQYYLEDVLAETRREMEREELKRSIEEREFSSMNLIQKHKAVEAVLDEKIRASLAADGGSVEVVDMREDNSYTDIYVAYNGACAGCPSSQTTTLAAITDCLQGDLNEKIRVFAV
jgi:NifU-like protein